MSRSHSIRCYDYVNHRYLAVRDLLCEKANVVFAEATRSAESRAESVAAGLHVNIAGIEIGKVINITIKGVEQFQRSRDESTSLFLEWEAADKPGLFPVMDGELSIYPLTAIETQLDFSGTWQPPLGVLGKAIDKIVGHRIAEASVHQFVSDVARYLRQNIKD